MAKTDDMEYPSGIFQDLTLDAVAAGAGVSADLRAVQVVDLIPYNTEADEAFDVVDGGFVSGEGDEEIPFAS